MEKQMMKDYNDIKHLKLVKYNNIKEYIDF